VPITSSASTPSTTTIGQPSARTASWIGSICREILGHRRAMLLVCGIHVVAERLALGVEHAGDILCRVIVAQLAQHVDHAVDCPCGQTFAIPQVRQSVIRAI
jgi:hypothetical protein